MEGFYASFICLLSVSLFLLVIAFKKLKENPAVTGIRIFRITLLIVVLLLIILAVVVAIILDTCSGWLCGLYEFIIALILAGVISVVSPLILLIIAKKRKD